MEENMAMIFDAFTHTASGHGAGGKKEMDGRQFIKFAKDSKVLGKKITSTDIDIIFAKAEHVSLHDNTDGYTGVHAKGGPSTVDGVHTANLAGIVDRTEGVHIDHHAHVEHGHAAPAATHTHPKKKKAPQVMAEAAPASSLEAVFHSFSGGAKEMDNRQFMKFAKDTKILDKKLTTTDVDIDFSKVKAKGARKITYTEFEKVLGMWATKKGTSFEDLEAKILAKGGPSFSGTKAAATKLHDDRSAYTGVYANGGPSTQGNGRAGQETVDDLSQLADRSGANLRGVRN